jgi:LmbE family N-acetylglucosaminyl deacetylase
MGSSYWLGRQKGAEAAYDSMLGHGASLWLERYVSVNNHEYIKMASPRGNPSITLIFVGLPDGNIPGTGFPSTHNQSLAKLQSGAISKMNTVDKQSSYTKTDLTNLLVSLMKYFRPDEVDTQTPVGMSPLRVDHSDHMTTGQFTGAAFAAYGQNIPLTYYTGYPIDQLTANVSGQDLADKSAAFYAYTVHDSNVCQTPAKCAGNDYSLWLERQYTYTPGMTPIPVVAPPAPTDTSGSSTPDTSGGMTPSGGSDSSTN